MVCRAALGHGPGIDIIVLLSPALFGTGPIDHCGIFPRIINRTINRTIDRIIDRINNRTAPHRKHGFREVKGVTRHGSIESAGNGRCKINARRSRAMATRSDRHIAYRAIAFRCFFPSSRRDALGNIDNVFCPFWCFFRCLFYPFDQRVGPIHKERRGLL